MNISFNSSQKYEFPYHISVLRTMNRKVSLMLKYGSIDSPKSWIQNKIHFSEEQVLSFQNENTFFYEVIQNTGRNLLIQLGQDPQRVGGVLIEFHPNGVLEIQFLQPRILKDYFWDQVADEKKPLVVEIIQMIIQEFSKNKNVQEIVMNSNLNRLSNSHLIRNDLTEYFSHLKSRPSWNEKERIFQYVLWERMSKVKIQRTANLKKLYPVIQVKIKSLKDIASSNFDWKYFLSVKDIKRFEKIKNLVELDIPVTLEDEQFVQMIDRMLSVFVDDLESIYSRTAVEEIKAVALFDVLIEHKAREMGLQSPQESGMSLRQWRQKFFTVLMQRDPKTGFFNHRNISFPDEFFTGRYEKRRMLAVAKEFFKYIPSIYLYTKEDLSRFGLSHLIDFPLVKNNPESKVRYNKMVLLNYLVPEAFRRKNDRYNAPVIANKQMTIKIEHIRSFLEGGTYGSLNGFVWTVQGGHLSKDSFVSSVFKKGDKVFFVLQDFFGETAVVNNEKIVYFDAEDSLQLQKFESSFRYLSDLFEDQRKKINPNFTGSFRLKMDKVFLPFLTDRKTFQDIVLRKDNFYALKKMPAAFYRYEKEKGFGVDENNTVYDVVVSGDQVGFYEYDMETATRGSKVLDLSVSKILNKQLELDFASLSNDEIWFDQTTRFHSVDDSEKKNIIDQMVETILSGQKSFHDFFNQLYPFEGLGGSNFSEKIKKRIQKKLGDEVFVKTLEKGKTKIWALRKDSSDGSSNLVRVILSYLLTKKIGVPVEEVRFLSKENLRRLSSSVEVDLDSKYYLVGTSISSHYQNYFSQKSEQEVLLKNFLTAFWLKKTNFNLERLGFVSVWSRLFSVLLDNDDILNSSKTFSERNYDNQSFIDFIYLNLIELLAYDADSEVNWSVPDSLLGYEDEYKQKIMEYFHLTPNYGKDAYDFIQAVRDLNGSFYLSEIKVLLFQNMDISLPDLEEIIREINLSSRQLDARFNGLMRFLTGNEFDLNDFSQDQAVLTESTTKNVGGVSFTGFQLNTFGHQASSISRFSPNDFQPKGLTFSIGQTRSISLNDYFSNEKK